MDQSPRHLKLEEVFSSTQKTSTGQGFFSSKQAVYNSKLFFSSLWEGKRSAFNYRTEVQLLFLFFCISRTNTLWVLVLKLSSTCLTAEQKTQSESATFKNSPKSLSKGPERKWPTASHLQRKTEAAVCVSEWFLNRKLVFMMAKKTSVKIFLHLTFRDILGLSLTLEASWILFDPSHKTLWREEVPSLYISTITFLWFSISSA